LHVEEAEGVCGKSTYRRGCRVSVSAIEIDKPVPGISFVIIRVGAV
jgi:hypothetical protein